jgi:outer membrane murein-binding lipoprotein Lpp
MRQFLARNEKAIDWIWKVLSIALLAGYWFLSQTFAARDDLLAVRQRVEMLAERTTVVELGHRVDKLEGFKSDAVGMVQASNAVQAELAKQVTELAKQVAVLASESRATTNQLERTNERLERMIERKP